MYRAPEMKLFSILSLIANVLALVALAMMITYYFFRNIEVNLLAAIISIIFSGFFKIQIYMYKVAIMEKRLLHMVEPSLQHFRVAAKKENVDLVIYFVLFWTALIGLTFAVFTPS